MKHVFSSLKYPVVLGAMLIQMLTQGTYAQSADDDADVAFVLSDQTCWVVGKVGETLKPLSWKEGLTHAGCVYRDQVIDCVLMTQETQSYGGSHKSTVVQGTYPHGVVVSQSSDGRFLLSIDFDKKEYTHTSLYLFPDDQTVVSKSCHGFVREVVDGELVE